jgi:3'(2'), 5'-bisphosphate nucleotidase
MNVDDLVGVAEAAGRELLKHYRGRVKTGTAGRATVRPSSAAGMLHRAIYLALGRDAAESASKAAYGVILAKLARLSPHIPVLSPMAQPPAYAERRGWNHVWLVDPLDGRAAFASESGDFTVNIALVEDGRPIYGVVHAPALGLTYFGRIGKGAFKRNAAGETLRLPSQSSVVTEANASNDVEAESVEGSRSLEMCRFTEQRPPALPLFGPTMEWQAAAAQAVLCLADVHLVAGESGKEPIFNSRELTIGSLEVCAEQPTGDDRASDRRNLV